MTRDEVFVFDGQSVLGDGQVIGPVSSFGAAVPRSNWRAPNQTNTNAPASAPPKPRPPKPEPPPAEYNPRAVTPLLERLLPDVTGELDIARAAGRYGSGLDIVFFPLTDEPG